MEIDRCATDAIQSVTGCKLGKRTLKYDELFVIIPVRLRLAEEDLPGHPISRAVCARCGEGVNDRREVRRDGRTLCHACAFGPYYEQVATGILAATLERAIV